jgi:hypothetical protein
MTGKPDYVVQTRRGLIPIEVKPTRTAARHTMGTLRSFWRIVC